ncbi:MAG: hypothetical protein WD766_12135 [Gemmatimonadota bacterium]
MDVPEKLASDESSACGGWSRLSEGLIAGVQHTLNNRMAALGAVSQVLEADLPAEHALAGAMTRELHRLESTVSLLALLTGDEAPEPVQLPSVVEEATQLFEMHHSLRDLRLDVHLPADLYPLWIPPSALRRALMVLLALAGMEARRGAGVVELRATGDAKTVELRVSAPGGDGDVGEIDENLEGVVAEAAAELLAGWGGEVVSESSGSGVGFRVSLLTLPEARNREASGGS